MSGSGGSDDWKYRGTPGEGKHTSNSKEPKDGAVKAGAGGASGGGASTPISKCDIFEETALNSPVPDVVKALRPGDILTLHQEGRTVVALTREGKRAGSITFRRLADLLECMDQQWTYVAEVKRITGGMCQVCIRPDQRP